MKTYNINFNLDIDRDDIDSFKFTDLFIEVLEEVGKKNKIKCAVKELKAFSNPTSEEMETYKEREELIKGEADSAFYKSNPVYQCKKCFKYVSIKEDHKCNKSNMSKVKLPKNFGKMKNEKTHK